MGVLIANLWCHNLDLGVIGAERVNQDSIIICCPHGGGVATFGVGAVVPASALTSTTCGLLQTGGHAYGRAVP